MSKQFTRREKILLVVFSLLLIAAVYYWLVQIPVSRQLAELGLAQQEAMDQTLLLQAKAEQQRSMEAELTAIFAAPRPIETPDYNNLEELMAFLNTVMAATKHYGMSFAPAEPAEGDTVLRRAISMEFSCESYTAARQVMQTLHDSPYRSQIGALTVLPLDADPVPGAATAPAPAKDLRSGPVQVQLSITFYEVL